MKITYFWDQEYATDEIGVQLNPENRHLVAKIEAGLNQERGLEVIDPMNQRKSMLRHSQVQLIEAMDHLSKIYTVDDRIFYAKGRLKEFSDLSSSGIVRINNSLMLNMKQVVSFNCGQHARLEVHTHNGDT